jgi:hypothetical protein
MESRKPDEQQQPARADQRNVPRQQAEQRSAEVLSEPPPPPPTPTQAELDQMAEGTYDPLAPQAPEVAEQQRKREVDVLEQRHKRERDELDRKQRAMNPDQQRSGYQTR